MAVDPKYIEEVRNPDEYDDILYEFGVEAEFDQIDNGVDISGYEPTMLKEMFDGEIYVGRPVLSDIYKVEFERDGEKTINWKIDFMLFDETYDDDPQVYIFPVNLKSADYDVENVHSTSGLYALTMDLMELKAKGISKAYNKLNLVKIKNLQKIVSKYSSMSVEVIEKKGVIDGEEKYWNAFRITEGE